MQIDKVHLIGVKGSLLNRVNDRRSSMVVHTWASSAGQSSLQGISLQGANLQKSATPCELKIKMPCQSLYSVAVTGRHAHSWRILTLLDLKS